MLQPRRRVLVESPESRDRRRASNDGTAAAIRIEAARRDDLEALYSIEKECFTQEAFSKELLASMLQRSDLTSLLAMLGSEIVGFIIAETLKKGGRWISHILTVDVVPKARKKGVGSRLLMELERRVVEMGGVECWLEVATANQAARKLYRGRGYVEADVIKNYYRSGEDCVIMNKKLR